MKQKFLKDLGIDINGETDELLQKFDLNGLNVKLDVKKA